MKSKHLPQPGARKTDLEAERNRKMAASAHAYVRGSTKHFYQWLETAKNLPDGPRIWICGDCHVGNMGPVANVSGVVAIEIRDFDQTVVGNPAYDLIRLGLSLAMAARGSDLPGVTTARMLEEMIEGYSAAFAPGGGEISDDTPMPKTIKNLMREAAGRSWKHLADERIEGIEPVIPLGKRFWPLADAERSAIETLFAEEPIRRLVTSLRSRESSAEVRVLDAAYWRKGCSSLGLLRYAVLVAVGEGKNEVHCLIDVKQAAAAAAPQSLVGETPADNGERVVEGARHLSPFLGGRMIAAHLLEKPVFIRELLPQDLKIEIDTLAPGEAMKMASYLANVVGRAHARQLSAPARKAWAAALQRNHSKALEAPNWLWNSVVSLVAAHEAAYLNHCRRYAMAEAA